MIIKNTYGVELNLPTVTVGLRTNFQDIPQLRYNAVVITGIEAYTQSQLLSSPTGKTIVSSTGILGISITLVVMDTEEVYQLPYYSLVSGLNSGIVKEFANKRINIVKSYATILNTTGINAGESLFLSFMYVPSLKN